MSMQTLERRYEEALKRIAELEEELAESERLREAIRKACESEDNRKAIGELAGTSLIIKNLREENAALLSKNKLLRTKNKFLQTKLDNRREAYDRLMNQFLDIKQSSFRNDVATTDELARVSAENFSLKAELDEFKRPYKG